MRSLCAPARALIDMEFVQFFPIGHLAPRLIGMDPIMWDPFRYKLGGRLLNKDMEEFTDRYGVPEDGKYVITRDVGTYAIIKEVEAGRGSPHGGAYLSFQHVPAAKLREAFGPVIDRLAANGIDLTKMPVEVAPIAHYHMGGVAADVQMQTEVPGLLVAGEAVGGANGANRLSGNAITEAFVFGRAGRPHRRRACQGDEAVAPAERRAARDRRSDPQRARRRTAQHRGDDRSACRPPCPTTSGRSAPATSSSARSPTIDELTRDARRPPVRRRRRVRHAAAGLVRPAQHAHCRARGRRRPRSLRTESRGAHQREDFPEMLPQWRVNQVVRLRGESLDIDAAPASPIEVAAQ